MQQQHSALGVRVKTGLFAAVLLLSAVGQPAQRASEPISKASPERLFRDYALAVCIADGYTSPEVKVDASVVASGYLEKGTYPLEAYNEIRELGRKYLQKDYPSIANAKLTLMKCIDFAQSAEAGRIMRKFRARVAHTKR